MKKKCENFIIVVIFVLATIVILHSAIQINISIIEPNTVKPRDERITVSLKNLGAKYEPYSAEWLNKEIDNLTNVVGDTIKLSNSQEINVKRMFDMTLMIESNYGRDNWKNGFAVSPFQYEMNTVQDLLSRNRGKKIKEELENKIGKKIDINKEEHCVYIAYLVYKIKLTTFQKHKIINSNINGSQDKEWITYKLLYNSTNGKSTYEKWLQREKEFSQL